jgi:predicted pyridoxine 5'-phosphate oxidase superfamily flavin-nucleotide-binding protein
MGILTGDMKRIVREQRLGYIATVCPDGTPNLSPKATMKVWDDDHLVFADLASPGTIANLKQNPAIEINMVDPFLRKGYRFKGTAEVLSPGPEFDNVMTLFADRQAGINASIRGFVMMTVTRALPVISPGYVGDVTEAQMLAQWEEYYASVNANSSERSASPTVS